MTLTPEQRADLMALGVTSAAPSLRVVTIDTDGLWFPVGRIVQIVRTFGEDDDMGADLRGRTWHGHMATIAHAPQDFDLFIANSKPLPGDSK